MPKDLKSIDMKTKIIIILNLSIILLNSCYSYRLFPKEFRKIENKEVPLKAYIINNTFKEELVILKSSTLFKIVEDSIESDLKIKLYALEKNGFNDSDSYTIFGWNAGGDLGLGLITLGQLPVLFDERYRFKFDEIKQDTIIENNFELKITQRFWFWDMFDFNKRFDEKAGKALLGSYMNN